MLAPFVVSSLKNFAHSQAEVRDAPVDAPEDEEEYEQLILEKFWASLSASQSDAQAKQASGGRVGGVFVRSFGVLGKGGVDLEVA